LIVVHGICEHSGRYGNVVEYFVPKGYAVYSFDQRGHGKSEGLRGYVGRFQYYLKDLETFFDMVRAKHGENMVFLVGHSMGGTIATAYVPDHQHELAGLVLSGPGLKVPSKVSPLLIALAPIGLLLLPKMGVHSLDPATVSRDKAVVDALLNDPLCYHGRISARLGAEPIRHIV